MGTSVIFEENDMPKAGRIILFRYEDGHINMITEKEVKNIPYCMVSYHDKLLVSIGNTVGEMMIIV